MNKCALLCLLVLGFPAPAAPAEEAAQWTELKLGEAGAGFALSPDRLLSYLGHPLKGVDFGAAAESVFVWPPSPEGSYSIACGGAGECANCFLLRLRERTASRLDLCRHPADVWWAPKGNIAAIATYDEGSALYALNVSSPVPREIAIGGITDPAEEMLYIPSQRPVWAGADSCLIRLAIRCSYDALRCARFGADIRKYELKIDFAALKARPRRLK